MLHGAGRSLGAAALTAGLAISRPCAAADSDAPRRIRTGAEILAFLALDFGLLYVSTAPVADPPGNVRVIDKLTLKAWSFDASSFATNFLAHPLAGSLFYTTARSNRSGPLESLGWASLASLTWEMAEFRENVSLKVDTGSYLDDQEPLFVRVKDRALGNEPYALTALASSQAVVGTLLDRRDEASIYALLQDRDDSILYRDLKPPRGEGSEKTNRFGILRDVNEATRSVRSTVESTNVHVSDAIDLGEGQKCNI